MDAGYSTNVGKQQEQGKNKITNYFFSQFFTWKTAKKLCSQELLRKQNLQKNNLYPHCNEPQDLSS